MGNQRQAFVDALRARLASISQESGYSSDIGLRVFDWRDPRGENVQESELPCCGFADESSQITAMDSVTHEHALTVAIWAMDQGQNASELARALEADVLKAIGTDQTFGGVCHYFQPTSSMTELKVAGKRSASVRLTFEVRIRLVAWDMSTKRQTPA